MAIKLDLKDKKIISLLDENARLSNSQIAKKVGLSKPAVEYRLNRFEKNGVIFSYNAIIDFTKLGYSQYKIYFKFQDAGLNDEKKIAEYWTNSNNVVWIGQIRGRWDLAVSVLARSNFEFGKILDGFMSKFSKFVLEKDILLTEYSPMFSRDFDKNERRREFVYGVPDKIKELDDADKKILKIISNDARINIIDLAEKAKLTRDIVNYRLKKMINEKIIVQFRAYPNLKNIGINQYKLIIRTKNFEPLIERRLKDYSLKCKEITQFLKLIGSWDAEIEIETENEDELYRIISEIRKEFSDIIRDFDILRITENYKYDFFPFD